MILESTDYVLEETNQWQFSRNTSRTALKSDDRNTVINTINFLKSAGVQVWLRRQQIFSLILIPTVILYRDKNPNHINIWKRIQKKKKKIERIAP